MCLAHPKEEKREERRREDKQISERVSNHLFKNKMAEGSRPRGRPFKIIDERQVFLV